MKKRINYQQKKHIKTLLKKILKENRFLDLPNALSKEGFLRVPNEDYNKITIDDFINANLMTYVKQRYTKAEIELSWYNNLNGYLNRNVILIFFIEKNNGCIQGYSQGMFIDAIQDKQDVRVLEKLMNALNSQTAVCESN